MEQHKEIKWKTISNLPIDNWRKLAKLFIKEKECFEKNKKSFGGCPLYRIIVFNSRTKVFAPHFIIKANKLGDYYYTGYYDKSGNAVVNEKESHCFSLELLSNCKDIYLVKEENMEMKETEIKIKVPDGYEVDKENSTFECIKFKPVVKRWRDDEYAEMSGFFIHSGDSEVKKARKTRNVYNCKCIFATEKQAKSALAMAQISQIMANDPRFGGVVTDKEWKEPTTKVSYICRVRNFAFYGTANTDRISYYLLAFHTQEQRDLFLKENEDLVKDYLMID